MIRLLNKNCTVKAALNQSRKLDRRVLFSSSRPMLTSGNPAEYEQRKQNTGMASWQPQNNSDIQRMTRNALVSTLQDFLDIFLRNDRF
jgi:hypothetical protein